MARGKQYDRTSDAWSIGCIDERESTPTRLSWTPDGMASPSPIRDARRRHFAGRRREASESRPTPRVAKPRPALTLAQRAVRDYRRAWRRIMA